MMERMRDLLKSVLGGSGLEVNAVVSVYVELFPEAAEGAYSCCFLCLGQQWE